jgi:metal-responsive CopG/Arc/MetJ family transcriptional regulator|tara:strand:- start:1261 stop:1401 length:141 start_codon:yes stop_codon:yes gene_type:complete
MRHKISITLDEDTLLKVRELLRCKTYRNKSHFFEIAASRLIDEVRK